MIIKDDLDSGRSSENVLDTPPAASFTVAPPPRPDAAKLTQELPSIQSKTALSTVSFNAT
ncbi:hypothetical protein PI125_g18663 [Phytophthora idaei]|nr:hypothetical protein PI125_g18663 [Phytophthora idaei]